MNIRDVKEFPSQGTEDNLYERLLEYIWAFDKGKTGKTIVQGASKEQISMLKEKLHFAKWNKKFPRGYEIFLETMGAKCPFVFWQLDGGGNTNIDVLTAWLAEKGEGENESGITPPPYHIPFFWQEIGEYFFYIDMSGDYPYPIRIEPHMEKENNSGKGLCHAESFEKLLFQTACYEYEKYGMSVSLIKKDCSGKVSRDDTIKILDSMRDFFRYQKAWFSDDFNYILLGGNITVLALHLQSSEPFGNTICIEGNADEYLAQSRLSSAISFLKKHGYCTDSVNGVQC